MIVTSPVPSFFGPNLDLLGWGFFVMLSFLLSQRKTQPPPPATRKQYEKLQFRKYGVGIEHGRQYNVGGRRGRDRGGCRGGCRGEQDSPGRNKKRDEAAAERVEEKDRQVSEEMPRNLLVGQVLPVRNQFGVVFPGCLYGWGAVYHLLPLQTLWVVLHNGGLYGIAVCGGCRGDYAVFE